jgi:deoxycytidylate deaminase
MDELLIGYELFREITEGDNKEEVLGQMFRELKEYAREHNTCTRGEVGARVILPDGSIYDAVSGSLDWRCDLNGDEYCIRAGDSEFLEMLTCPSQCAETGAVIKAVRDGKELYGGVIISTHDPCERCASIITDAGISRMYFDSFKNDEIREKDLWPIFWMLEGGVSVAQMNEGLIKEYNIREVADTLKTEPYARPRSALCYLITLHNREDQKMMADYLRKSRLGLTSSL